LAETRHRRVDAAVGAIVSVGTQEDGVLDVPIDPITITIYKAIIRSVLSLFKALVYLAVAVIVLAIT
jgi:hypothetical protein